jgi:hypothetical protein
MIKEDAVIYVCYYPASVVVWGEVTNGKCMGVRLSARFTEWVYLFVSGLGGWVDVRVRGELKSSYICTVVSGLGGCLG